MKQVSLNGQGYLLVGLSVNAENIELHDEDGRQYITYHVWPGTEDYDILRQYLPVGKYELVDKASSISEEQARGMVDKQRVKTAFVGQKGEAIFGTLYTNYESRNDTRFDTALASLQSWVRSEGFNPEETVIVKIEK